MLTIYGPARSRASRVLWMLAECKVPFEHEDLTRYPTMDQKAAAVKAIYPLGKVPVLKDGDLTLAESMAINLYLAQHYGPQLWPRDQADQARALQWSFFAVTEVDPPLIQLLIERTFRKEGERNAENERRNEELLHRPLTYLEQWLAGRPYLLGDTFTVADLNLASIFSLAAGARVDLAAYPHLRDWLDRCFARPAWQQVKAPGS